MDNIEKHLFILQIPELQENFKRIGKAGTNLQTQ